MFMHQARKQVPGFARTLQILQKILWQIFRVSRKLDSLPEGAGCVTEGCIRDSQLVVACGNSTT